MNLDQLYAVADDNGIPVIPFPLGNVEAMSYMDGDGQTYIGIDPERISSNQDEKLKLSHELGHCMTGAFYNVFASCDIWKKQENRANKWSYQHLVSKKEIAEAVRNGFREIWELAELFDVPPETMARICSYYKYNNLDFAV